MAHSLDFMIFKRYTMPYYIPSNMCLTEIIDWYTYRDNKF